MEAMGMLAVMLDMCSSDNESEIKVRVPSLYSQGNVNLHPLSGITEECT